MSKSGGCNPVTTMSIQFELKSLASRLTLAVSSLLAAIALINISADRLILTTYSDPKSAIATEQLASAADSFPVSGLLQAQYAARLIETASTSGEGYEQEAGRSVDYASRAVKLAPQNFEDRLLLAEALEMNGEPAGAEQQLREALRLAPNQAAIHWRLANLLVRAGKLDESIEFFRRAIAAFPERAPLALDLLWTATDGDLKTIHLIAGEDAISQLNLSFFLSQRRRFDDAIQILQRVDSREALAQPLLPKIFDEMLAAKQIEPAGRLWRSLLGADEESRLWNGGFEKPIRRNLTAFDWILNQSRYAEIGITTSDAHSGARSLKIMYRGIDTSRLETEIRHRVIVTPGERYTLSFAYKTKDFSTLKGPAVVVTTSQNSPLAQSSMIVTGSQDWRSERFDFIVSSEEQVVFISIQQTPKFSYSTPTRGTIWFDDFAVSENRFK